MKQLMAVFCNESTDGLEIRQVPMLINNQIDLHFDFPDFLSWMQERNNIVRKFELVVS